MKNIKRIAIIFTAVFLLTAFTVVGYCATNKTYSDGNGNTYTYVVENGEAKINEFSTVNEIVDLVIPSSIDGYPVTGVKNCPFSSNKEALRSVVLPDTFTEIGASLFYGCENLVSVKIPDGIKSIGTFAFANCPSLSMDLVFHKELERIYSNAFEDCPQIKSITFDDDCTCIIEESSFANTGVEDIFVPEGINCGPACFAECKSLKTAVIKGGAWSYNKEQYQASAVFANCTSLETVTLSEKFGLWGATFSGCEALKSVQFETEYAPTDIPSYAFYDCKSLALENIKNLSLENVATVHSYAFYNCENMAFDMQRNFPSLSKVWDYGFSGCKKLTNLVIKDMTVYNSAFAECTSLKSVTFSGRFAKENRGMLPKAVFENCSNLETIIFSGKVNFRSSRTYKIIDTQNFTGCNIKTVVFDDDFDVENIGIIDSLEQFLTVKFPYFESYEVGTNKLRLFTVDGVLYMRETDANGKELITLLSYPNAKKGEYYSTASAFPDYDGYFTIANNSFRKTRFLKYVTFAHTLLREEDFYDEHEYVTFKRFPNYKHAFDSSSVEEITFLKNSFDSIQWDMFYASKIRKIDLSDCIFIDDYAFYGCKNLQTVDLPRCESVEKYSFAYCTSLKNVNMPNCYGIGAGAFAYCSELSYINIPNCEVICAECFTDCKSLTYIALVSVDCIERNVFDGCENLALVSFGSDKCKINDTAFSNCPNVSFYCDEQSDAYIYAEKHNIPVITYSVLFYNTEDTFEYTGKEIRPAIIVAFGDTVLVENRDYVIEYFNNIETYDVSYLIVHFIGDFEGLNDVGKRFYIVARNISPANILYVKDNVYDGEEIKPAVVVEIDGKELKDGVDYDIIYHGGIDTGTMFFTVKGKGNYTGEINCYYNIIRRDIAEATVNKIPDQIYTGEGVCPAPTITWNGFTLTEGEDYEIRYFDNVNVGYATAVIYGKGNFCGTLIVNFKIFGKDISKAEICDIPEAEYTGAEIMPAVTVIMDGKTLNEGIDYLVSYSNNIESGTATVTVSGIGNYSGVYTKEFNIYKNSVYSFTVFSETQMTATFNGTALKPEMEVYFGDELLTEGVDYEVRLENNTNAGTATVTIIGIGRFEGERSFSFTILPCKISEDDISIIGSTAFNGKPVTPQVVIEKNGLVLENGKDFIVTYGNNNDVGTAYVTIEGAGNYFGRINIEFEIYNSTAKLGDLNGDGNVTIIDLKWLLQSLVGKRTLTENQKVSADLNRDGHITLLDVKWLLEVIVGKKTLNN